jgi:hypothetical protein
VAERPARDRLVLVTLALLLGACASPAPSPTPAPAAPTPGPTATPAASIVTPIPTPTPAPPLSLPLPPNRDMRRVTVSVKPQVAENGNGTITVTVKSLATEMIPELVLRWPTALDQVLFLAPFRPSQSRLGTALVQAWTKWVVGPGESGEPAGTTSLGYGPLLAGATLTIPLYVTREAPGPVAFDLQLLAGEALLTSQSGGPAWTRVTVP